MSSAGEREPRVPVMPRGEEPADDRHEGNEGAHPGGGVTGAPGHNAAQVILSDLRRRKFRRFARQK